MYYRATGRTGGASQKGTLMTRDVVGDWDARLHKYVRSMQTHIGASVSAVWEQMAGAEAFADSLSDMLRTAIQSSDDGLTWHNFDPVREELACPCIAAVTRSRTTNTVFKLFANGPQLVLYCEPEHIGNLSLADNAFWHDVIWLRSLQKVDKLTINLPWPATELAEAVGNDTEDSLLPFSICWSGEAWITLIDEVAACFHSLCRLDYQLWQAGAPENAASEDQLLSYCFTRELCTQQKAYRCDWYEVAMTGLPACFMVLVHLKRNKKRKVILRACNDSWLMSGEVDGLEPDIYDLLTICTSEYMSRKRKRKWAHALSNL